MARKSGVPRVSAAWSTVHASFTDRVSQDLFRRAPRASPPVNLYHFTDCDGLIGILNNKTLRASLATSLNDRSETQHGMTLLRGLVRNRELKTKWLPTDRLENVLDRPPSWRHYVISFCAKSDTALHWLHYGRSGAGVAIGFDSNALRTAARKQQFKLYPVVYNEQRQQSWLASIVDTVDVVLGRRLKRLKRRLDRDLLMQVALELLVNHIWGVMPRMKAPVFEPELEWRLVASIPSGALRLPTGIDPTGTTSFRSTAGRIVPFKEVRFGVLPAVELVIGASAQVRQDPAALDVLMDETLGARIKVSDSPVPLRS